MRLHFIFIFLVPLFCSSQESKTPLQGEYFGQQPPENEAFVFAKNIISTELYVHSAPAFAANGKTVLWTIVERNKTARLMEMTMNDNTWSSPHAPLFADTAHDDFYPFFSYDGKQLFFSSRRLLPSGKPPKDMALWVVERRGNSWGIPVLLDTSVSKGVEYAHSVSKYGNLFFSTRNVIDGEIKWMIYSSKYINGKYCTPEALDTSINNGSYVDGPLVSPDESFLIFESDRAGSIGSLDLYICFKESNGKWSIPKNMGAKINSTAAERFAGLSPDGKYLFFGSNRASELPDVFWINSSIINKLK